MPTDEEKKREIREMLEENHVGKGNAIFSGEIADEMGIPDDDTHVNVREYLSELLQEGLPLAGNPGHGYWIIDSQEELDNYVGSLERRARSIDNRKLNVLEAAESYPDLEFTDEDML
jgi:NDP-sugar pyrophosphorylase family protein